MHRARFGGLLGLFAAICVQAPAAHAQSTTTEPSATPAPSSDSGDETDETQYAWLDEELARVEAPTVRWYTGWTATYGWLAAGQFALAAAAPNAGLRVDSIVGGINASLGLFAILTAPHTMAGARDQLRRFDASTPLGAYERRRRAEFILHATAAEEHFYGSWIPLAIAVVPSSIGAYILIHDYDQKLGGLAILGGGIGATLLQILTRPSRATDAWKRYVDKYHPGPNIQMPSQDLLNLSFAVTPMGVAAAGTF